MRDLLPIFRRNLSSPIVLAILILAATLAILHEYRDAWFLSVVILVNTLIAIVQEIRASIALEKLELMSAPLAHRFLNDGDIEDIKYDQLVLDDVIELRLGDEVPADCQIVESRGLEVDESILTGESVQIEKQAMSITYAASTVVAGSARARVIAVGQSTRIGSMTISLKSYKPGLTPMQFNILKAITWLTYGAIALSLLIVVTYSLSGESAVRIFKTIASAAITVVPEGLLLASSLLLAFGSLKLAQAKVLPQKLAAIEAMAQLDVLCVDKTGTLTNEEIKYEQLEILDGAPANIAELIGISTKETDTGSATNNAILSELKAPSGYKVIQRMAFSSKRKMSGVMIEYGGKIQTILVGAPEYMSEIVDISSGQTEYIQSLTSVGKRVLLAAIFTDKDASIHKLKPKSGKAVALIVLANELREGLTKTVKYLQKNGVSLRVISGDNLDTVKYVAKQAGIKNSHQAMTGAQLQEVEDEVWDKTIAATTIFARVLPEQKEHLIETFKRLGYYTGMVGDGVNDALALKKSDLGIAMYAGAAATRKVADIVILNNSFNSLPIGMRLGNRIIQAIQIIATLFFHKIIFGVVLLLSTIAMGMVYPFEPRHITFMNIFLVTLPTIMWTLFPPIPRYRPNPKYFWRDTLWAVSPIAILSGITVVIVYMVLSILHPENTIGVSTTTVIVATFLGIYLVFLVPMMFDVKNNRGSFFARLFYTIAVLLVVIPSFSLSFIRDFFNFTTPTWRSAWPLMLVVLGVLILQWLIATTAKKRLQKRNSNN
ncbi:MAG: HAD-IC family P-type ATPase [Candidatus Saccharimonadales bacterium]